MSSYQFNRFAMVTQVDNKIFINATPSLRATFDVAHRPIIDFFSQSKSFTEDQALRLIAPSRLSELLEKKIIVQEAANDQVGRYSRQLGYFSITSDSPSAVQERLQQSHVLILGAGAIGSHSCWNLAAMGIGRLTVLDFDVVEESNLNRQLMYTPKNIGELKVDVLRDRLQEFNPTIKLVGLNRRLDSEEDVSEIINQLGKVDLIVKAIDSPENSMEFVNRVCVRDKIPFVTGGFMDFIGVVGPNYIPGHSTCFACHTNHQQVRRLYGTGPTFAPLTTLVSSMVAMVTHKILLGEPASVADKVFSYNTMTSSWDTEMAKPVRACEVCGLAPESKANVADPQKSQINLFRWAFLAVMTTTIVLRQMFDQKLIGVLSLLVVLLSIPVVHAICDRNGAKTRREFFVNACIYISFSIVALLSESYSAGQFALPKTTADIFVAVRWGLGLIGQSVIGITVLFLLQSGFLEFIPRLLEFLKTDITLDDPHAT